MAFPLTNASATLARADARIRWSVGCETFMVAAAFSCSRFSSSASLSASNSSTANVTFSSAFSGMPLGLKNVAEGSMHTNLRFLGLTIVMNIYS
jgi:hypothetical protein